MGTLEPDTVMKTNLTLFLVMLYEKSKTLIIVETFELIDSSCFYATWRIQH